MRSVSVAAASLIVLCLLPLAPLAFGQGGTGTITGTVTDPTGLAVAGANVQARNTETGVIYSGASTASGNYTVPNLPVGTYEVAVIGQGDRVAIRPVKVGQTDGTNWVVQDGLKPGERVVVEGQQKLRPGMQVQPKPFRAN